MAFGRGAKANLGVRESVSLHRGPLGVSAAVTVERSSFLGSRVMMAPPLLPFGRTRPQGYGDTMADYLTKWTKDISYELTIT